MGEKEKKENLWREYREIREDMEENGKKNKWYILDNVIRITERAKVKDPIKIDCQANH